MRWVAGDVRTAAPIGLRQYTAADAAIRTGGSHRGRHFMSRPERRRTGDDKRRAGKRRIHERWRPYILCCRFIPLAQPGRASGTLRLPHTRAWARLVALAERKLLRR